MKRLKITFMAIACMMLSVSAFGQIIDGKTIVTENPNQVGTNVIVSSDWALPATITVTWYFASNPNYPYSQTKSIIPSKTGTTTTFLPQQNSNIVKMVVNVNCNNSPKSYSYNGHILSVRFDYRFHNENDGKPRLDDDRFGDDGLGGDNGTNEGPGISY